MCGARDLDGKGGSSCFWAFWGEGNFIDFEPFPSLGLVLLKLLVNFV